MKLSIDGGSAKDLSLLDSSFDCGSMWMSLGVLLMFSLYGEASALVLAGKGEGDSSS